MALKIIRSLKQDLTYQDAKNEIFSDENFLNDLKSIASNRKLPIEDAKSICYKYLKEIATRCTRNKFFWSAVKSIIRRRIIGSFDNVYYNSNIVKSIVDLAKDNIITFTPNHRSVFDFLILPYILAKETGFMPIALAADVFNKFPMGYIFRKAGAYYVRRNESDEMYFLVFKYYFMLLLNYEFMQLFFIEGGRNKSGGYSEPKAGILKYIIEGKKKYNIKKDILFFPVNISYDFVPESNVVIEEHLSGIRKSIFSSVSKYATKRDLRNCYLNFGEPIHLSEFLEKSPEREAINLLGNSIIENIKSLVTVSPIALLCYSLQSVNTISVRDFEKRYKANYEFLERSHRNIRYIELGKIPEYLSFAEKKWIIGLSKDKNLILLDNNKKRIVEYYSNNIRHLF